MALFSPRSLAAVGLVLSILFWAGNALFARAVADSIPPFALALGRWCLAFLVLLPFILRSAFRHRQALLDAGWRLPVLALFGIASYNSLLYSAAHSTEAINITLLNTCLPLVMFIGAGLLLGEWPNGRTWLGMLIALCGLLLLISRGSWQVVAALQFRPGDLLMLLAVLAWSIYSLLLRYWRTWLAPIPPLVLLGVLIGLGIPLILPFFLFELSQGATLVMTPLNLSAIGYTAIFASLVAYLCWNNGVRVLGTASAALFNYLMPVFAAFFGWLLLDEHLQAFHWYGGALILFGLLLASWRPEWSIGRRR